MNHELIIIPDNVKAMFFDAIALLVKIFYCHRNRTLVEQWNGEVCKIVNLIKRENPDLKSDGNQIFGELFLYLDCECWDRFYETVDELKNCDYYDIAETEPGRCASFIEDFFDEIDHQFSEIPEAKESRVLEIVDGFLEVEPFYDEPQTIQMVFDQSGFGYEGKQHYYIDYELHDDGYTADYFPGKIVWVRKSLFSDAVEWDWTVPGLDEWYNDTELVMKGYEYMEDFDWDAHNRRGYELAALISKKLPENWTMKYVPFNQKS